MRSRFLTVLFAVAFLMGVIPLGTTMAAPPSDAAVTHQVQAVLDHAAVADGPGVAMLVARGDTVLFRGARGRADIELGVPLSPDQVFRIASVTKMFTAATVVKLAEQGKLSLDDPLAKYFPAIPDAAHITLRQLLNHTAGISDKSVMPQPGVFRRDIDTAAHVAEISKRSPDFSPGTRWAYSNAGYILLGAVIEKVTGDAWYVTLQKQLIDPLGLQHTRYGDTASLIAGRVAGYTTDNPEHRIDNAAFISASVPAAAGALVSTLDDLRLWMRALASGRAIGGDGFRQMMTATPDLPGASPAHRYGLGMYLWQVRGSTMVGHTGQIDGFASAVVYLPKEDITVVVLANDDNFDARTMSRRLVAIALGQPYPDVADIAPSDETLRSLEGKYQYDETTVLNLSVKANALYFQRGSRPSIRMQVTAGQALHFIPDELSYLQPVRDASGKVIRLDYFEGGDGPPKAMLRIAGP
ncbi:CubicO group peptidase, beta-lactamase class C family [Dyella sp. OK004]|uniref:serine hydrolase domain-containing protein n=1 Tax=Dyella sp. OK004 TaxID=1855292 RepID=UPI0008E9F2C1|nr:serine hydrolase domain-containing protein [Dyella sp. OK004]SFS16482.1 CubicO group peptidase, beta-lactamase class C family [Dyella sp. OK004]